MPPSGWLSPPVPRSGWLSLSVGSPFRLALPFGWLSPPVPRSGRLSLSVGSPFRLLAPSESNMRIVRGSVLDHDIGPRVNAANVIGIGGGGVDQAFNEEGGQALISQRQKLPRVNSTGARIPLGDSVVTGVSGTIIHTVGPDFRNCPKPIGMAVLRAAYNSVLQTCQQNGWDNVGFCLLSAGVFRGHVALIEIISTAVDCLFSSDTTLYCFTDEEYRLAQLLMQNKQ